MVAFTDSSCVEFQARLDSKGRVTVPSEIRDRLSLGPGSELTVSVSSSRRIVEDVGSRDEAIELLQKFDSVRSFIYQAGTVEVVVDVET